MISLLSPADGARITLLRERHLEYIAHPYNDPTVKVDWLNLREAQDDQSYPVPVRFAYAPAVPATIVLRDPDGNERRIPAADGSAEATNLRIDADYTWQVVTEDDASPVFAFHTDPQPPRLLRVDGITNVRDFGGFRTAEGRRVRQDRIYRTSEMDSHLAITPEGKRVLEEELGVRTDLDLRGIKDEPRGPVLDPARVKWRNFPLAAYDQCFSGEQIRLFGDAYRVLLDEANYPVICHCWGGIDRTGCWLFILGAMLGVAEDDLALDYEFSSFSRWSSRSRYSKHFTDFMTGLREFGSAVREMATNYMKAGGLSDADLDTLRKLLLEDA